MKDGGHSKWNRSHITEFHCNFGILMVTIRKCPE